MIKNRKKAKKLERKDLGAYLQECHDNEVRHMENHKEYNDNLKRRLGFSSLVDKENETPDTVETDLTTPHRQSVY